MSKIKKLDKNLINLIAAGEVVERPASALKELMENSIDAGATEITVELKDYGIEQISVKDNGIGMDYQDAIMAFEQHATSKITTKEDLEKIITMGFRGEALASISSVADSIELETKAAGSDPVKIKIEQENITKLNSTQIESGTTIKINKIFEKIPARKKFLKAQSTELKYLIDTFINTALPYTGIHFKLIHNNKIIHNLTKEEDIKNRLFQIWGGLVKDLYSFVELESTEIKIKAIIGNSNSAKRQNKVQYTYLNNRFITNKTISAAIQEAFNGFINRELKPTYFIFIEANPQDIDINIHPRKLEAKFSNTDLIFRTVFSITKKTLEKNTKEIIVSELDNSSMDNLDTSVNSNRTPSNLVNLNNYNYPKNNAESFQKRLIRHSDPTFLDFSKSDNQEEVSLSNYANLKPYQIFNTYIVIEKEDKLLFIDQHAAAEKITFEKLINNLTTLTRKPLLIPEVIELTPIEKEILTKNKDSLIKIGFVIEDFGVNTIQVTEIPEPLERFNIKEYFNSIINPDDSITNNFGQFETFNGVSLTRDLYLILATIACHSSIRAGQKLQESEMNSLISKLTLLENPYNCPHGRPVIWQLPKYEIEKGFRRKL